MERTRLGRSEVVGSKKPTARERLLQQIDAAIQKIDKQKRGATEEPTPQEQTPDEDQE